jgi:hypothetical protein
MCCFVIILAFLGPRLALLYAWIFTPRVVDAFAGGFWLPLLGLLFLPWTVLGYVLAWSPAGGVTGLGWAVVALGLIFDLSSYGSRAAQGRYSSSK